MISYTDFLNYRSMQSQKSFIIQLLGLSALLEIVALGWMFAMPKAWVTPLLWGLPFFFMIVTYVIHRSFIGALDKNARQFSTRYMLVTTIKLLSFLFILLAYAVLVKEDAMPFLLSFFSFYLIYSGFEAVSVIKLNNEHFSKK